MNIQKTQFELVAFSKIEKMQAISMKIYKVVIEH